MKWNRKAAAQGHVMAQIYLRVMYQSGQYGVEKDAKEGFKWGLKAAEQGDRYSQSEIMRLYDKGIGVLQDYVTAYAWAIIVEANGSESAKSFKSRLAKKMTPEEITKAEALSKEMIKKNPKLLQKKK